MRKKSRHGGRAKPSSVTNDQDEDSEYESVSETLSERNDVGIHDDIAPNLNHKTIDCTTERYSLRSQDVFSEDSMEIDWLKKEFCIRCNRGGQVLVCSETGCPIALHEKCLCSEPKFDDLGNFYCPYCSYKRAVVETQELKKKAMLAKKALSSFMDIPVGGNRQKQIDGEANRKEPNVSLCGGSRNDQDNAQLASDNLDKIVVDDEEHVNPSVVNANDNLHFTEERTAMGTEPLQDSITREKSNEEKIPEAHQSEFVKDGERIQAEDSQLIDDSQREKMVEEEDHAVPLNARIQAEDSQLIDDSQHEEIVEEEEQTEHLRTCHVDEEMNVDGAPHVSKEGSEDGIKISEDNQDRRENEEQMQPQELQVPANANVGFKTNGSDTETISVRQRRVKQRAHKKPSPQNAMSPRKSSSWQNSPANKIAKKPNEKVATSKKSRQPQEWSKQFTNLAFPTAKRKRLHWTVEEEDMLKEGVQKFSTATNKNLPWRKILDFGRHVFDVTRTPVDLKDKWRNIMTKESSTIKR